MFEFLFELIGELLLQIVIEMLGELGLRALGEPFRKKRHPYLSALGYAVLGAVAGVLSLGVFPDHLVAPPFRIANLILTPLLVGLMMSALGAWRAQQGLFLLRWDRFAYGYIFALALALIRYYWAN